MNVNRIDFIVKENINDHLQCPICLDIINNPVIHSCGRSFCKECMNSVQNNKSMKEEINNLEVFCKHCGKTEKLSNLNKHRSTECVELKLKNKIQQLELQISSLNSKNCDLNNNLNIQKIKMNQLDNELRQKLTFLFTLKQEIENKNVIIENYKDNHELNLKKINVRDKEIIKLNTEIKKLENLNKEYLESKKRIEFLFKVTLPCVLIVVCIFYFIFISSLN
ncbi:hypothetical protein ABK040_001302 [Willaertia magna]